MLPWFFLAIAIVTEVIGTSFLKASAGFSKPLPVIAVVLGYGFSFYFLSLTLETLPVGIAYAVWSGVGLVLITAVAWVAYDQTLDLPAVFGMGLILAGVVILNLFSTATGH